MIKDVAPLPGFPEQIGLLAAILQDATSDWRGEIWEEFPPEITTWRPYPGGPSIGGEFLHMIVVELYWLEQFALSREVPEAIWKELMADQIDVDNGLWPEAPAEPLEWYYALQDRYRERTLETLADWPALETLMPMEGRGDYSLRWVLGHVIQHEAYHGGQIAMLTEMWKRR